MTPQEKQVFDRTSLLIAQIFEEDLSHPRAGKFREVMKGELTGWYEQVRELEHRIGVLTRINSENQERLAERAKVDKPAPIITEAISPPPQPFIIEVEKKPGKLIAPNMPKGLTLPDSA